MNSNEVEGSMNIFNLTGGYQFSAIDMEELQATEYTLVTIVVDVSYSVSPFSKELMDSVKSIVEACKRSPRADNLLIRLVTFNNNVNEEHGFKLLTEIDVDAYDDEFNCSSTTALYDATSSTLEAMGKYGYDLAENGDYTVSGIQFILTDGEDNASKRGANSVSDMIDSIKRAENLEELVTIVIGMTNDQQITQYLQTFKEDAGLDQFVALPDVTSNTLAKLAKFISKSISASSQALTNGDSTTLVDFNSVDPTAF